MVTGVTGPRHETTLARSRPETGHTINQKGLIKSDGLRPGQMVRSRITMVERSISILVLPDTRKRRLGHRHGTEKDTIIRLQTLHLCHYGATNWPCEQIGKTICGVVAARQLAAVTCQMSDVNIRVHIGYKLFSERSDIYYCSYHLINHEGVRG